MIILDDNHKVRRLIEGHYENDDVLFWNSNEAEMRPDYDYTTLKAKSFIEVTGNLDGIKFSDPNHRAVIWPWMWLLDTIRTCWNPVNPDYTDPDRYWQVSKEPTDYYTCMLGQDRPHRQSVYDLLVAYEGTAALPYVTFVGQGICADVQQEKNQEINRVNWTPRNQILTHQFPPWYDNVVIDLVVETHEDMTFYTEKTWKPLLGMRLPLIFGNVHMYDQLSDWGFYFCENMIDYSFSKEDHPYIRAKRLIEELMRIKREVPLDVLHKESLGSRKTNQRLCFDLLEDIEIYDAPAINPTDVSLLKQAKEIKSTLDL